MVSHEPHRSFRGLPTRAQGHSGVLAGGEDLGSGILGVLALPAFRLSLILGAGQGLTARQHRVAPGLAVASLQARIPVRTHLIKPGRRLFGEDWDRYHGALSIG